MRIRLLWLEYSPGLAGNKNRLWRRDVVSLGKIALVDRQAHTPPRVYVHERLPQRHIGEGLHEWKAVERKSAARLAQRDGHPFASTVAEFAKLLAADVCNQIAEWPI